MADPRGDFIYSPIIIEDTMAISSAYRVPNTTHVGNIFSIFDGVPNGLWIGYILSFFLFVSVSYIGSVVIRKPMSSLWNIICAFLDQDNFPSDSRFMESLSLS